MWADDQFWLPLVLSGKTIQAKFTFGKNNTKEELKAVLKILPPLIKRLRRMAPEL